jgi:XTP/dITP diphosphohydrolase
MNHPWDRLVVATMNKGKVKEFAYRLTGLVSEIYSLADFSNVPPIVEDGITFLENAEKKARIIGTKLGELTLADDSGLCVDALQGQPGVYSARYAGEHADDHDNVNKLLHELRNVNIAGAEDKMVHPNHPLGYKILSPAYYSCALVLYNPAENFIIRVEETCSGWIIDTPCGEGGFGYDPIFYLPEFGQTMAELSLEQKNMISHRGKALDRLISQL